MLNDWFIIHSEKEVELRGFKQPLSHSQGEFAGAG